jgi:hypothetical protein
MELCADLELYMEAMNPSEEGLIYFLWPLTDGIDLQK